MSIRKAIFFNLLITSALVLIAVSQLGCPSGHWLCVEEKETRLRIGINPWPGYAALFVAEEKGYFDDVGMAVELVEIGSLSDIRRAFERGRINLMACTLIEVVEAAERSHLEIEVPLIFDYSDGGDVILARSPIRNVGQLEGKRIGVESASLGMYVIHRALESVGLSTEDVELVHVEQAYASGMMRKGELDAVVTYPPFSTQVSLENPVRKIFDSSTIPQEVVDVLATSRELHEEHLDEIEKLIAAWDRAVQFCQDNPSEAIQIMARRTGMTRKEFKKGFKGVTLMTSEARQKAGYREDLAAAIRRVQKIQFPKRAASDLRRPENYIASPLAEEAP